MKQAPKRALSVVLAFCLVLTMFTGLISTQAASPFPDLSTSHWAYDVIVGMYNMGFVKGDNKGNVKPESYVTTTEFMALINRMFGLYLTTSTNYADTAGHWGNNENVFSYAAAQGYIIAESGNKIQPDAYLTREKAFALIARYLGLDEINYGGFTDSGSMSAAYRGLINAASVLGIAEGYPDGSFKPQQYLRRSEAMKILYYMVGGNIITGSSTGVYNSSASKSQISAAITGRNAVLSNSTLRGTVYVSEGATNGTVTISDDYFVEWDIKDYPKPDDIVLGVPEDSGASDPMNFSTDGHRAQIEDMVHAIECDADPMVTAREGRKAIELIRAVYESSQKGSRIDF